MAVHFSVTGLALSLKDITRARFAPFAKEMRDEFARAIGGVTMPQVKADRTEDDAERALGELPSIDEIRRVDEVGLFWLLLFLSLLS